MCAYLSRGKRKRKRVLEFLTFGPDQEAQQLEADGAAGCFDRRAARRTAARRPSMRTKDAEPACFTRL
jgi:hypothetical protein